MEKKAMAQFVGQAAVLSCHWVGVVVDDDPEPAVEDGARGEGLWLVVEEVAGAIAFI